MSADFIDWRDEHSLDHRRRLRNAMLVSLAFHGMIFAAFAVAPSRAPVPMPAVLMVDLVSGPPAAPSPKSSSPPAAPKPSAPKPPAAEPPPKAPAPVAKAPVQVLPEESSSRIRPVAPKPKPEAKPPRPQPKPELSYEAAMEALDEELGVDETASLLAPPRTDEPEPSSGQAESPEAQAAGTVVSPELAAWALATRRRIQSKWVMPPSFRGRGLATTLEFQLSANGVLVGVPRVAASSGDPHYDDNTVRAIMAAAPLPPPPKAGLTLFIFRSEGL